MLAHNGEINTRHGNINWMKSHETRLAARELEPFIDDIKPVVQAGGSDTATLDNVFELLVRAGRDAPMAKALMIPASIGSDATMPTAHRDMFLYCNAVMEPWDGPAAIAATDGRWVIAGLDRNGLRPLRYTVTGDEPADRRLRDRHGEARRSRHRRARAASGRARRSASIWTSGSSTATTS